MYLTAEQRYNIAMRMLSIVEHMAFGRVRESSQEVAKPPRNEAGTDEEDSALNDMIRTQLKAAGTEFMNEEVGDDLQRE